MDHFSEKVDIVLDTNIKRPKFIYIGFRISKFKPVLDVGLVLRKLKYNHLNQKL